MSINSNLSIIAKDHIRWVKIVRSLGESNYSEDIVQDVYLKIHRLNYYNKIITEGKVNMSYMYVILRSAVRDHQKISKKTTLTLNDNFFLENMNNSGQHDKIYFIKTDELNKEKEASYLAICENIDKEIDTWHWYDREVFKIYRMHWKDQETLNRLLDEFNGKVSIRKIAKNTNISWTTLFHELKESKLKIKEKFSEDWEDYKNQDYHLIHKQ